jgi:hypothetical protein
VIAAIAAGDQAGSRNAADGSRDKVVAEEHAIARQPIDVRRLQERMAGAAQAIGPLIVGQQEKDIGATRGVGPGGWDAPK